MTNKKDSKKKFTVLTRVQQKTISGGGDVSTETQTTQQTPVKDSTSPTTDPIGKDKGAQAPQH